MSGNIGQYEIIRELGSGTYGTVYLAEGEVPGKGVSGPRRRKVAIKKLKNPTDASALDALRREFELLDQVKHRSVCKVYEFLEDERAVVMEYVQGYNLREIVDACNKAREAVFSEAAIEIGCEVADCLFQAHTTPGRGVDALQIVHRDLKPENIILTPKGEVMVLDFGLARVAKKGKRDDDRIKGTPLYMAPEQVSGKPVDHRSDLFALGLVLYELISGRPAYVVPREGRDPVGDTMALVERADLREQIRELESKLPDAGPVIARLLSANPRGRYENGHELMLDLRRHLMKDRGAYLHEFADYFYANIKKLDVSGGNRGSTGESSMSKGGMPPRPGPPGAPGAGGPPRPGGPPGPGGPPAHGGPPGHAGPPRPGGPPSGPPMGGPPGGPGGPPRPGGPPGASGAMPAPPRPGGPPGASGAMPAPPRPGGPPGPPRPGGPVGGPPAVVAPPHAPPAAPPVAPPKAGKPSLPGVKPATDLAKAGPPAKGKKPGPDVRRPDEAGMLQMTSLAEEDDDEAEQPKSATQFFSIPAPKKKPGAPSTPPPKAAPMLGGGGKVGAIGAAGGAPAIGGPTTGGPGRALPGAGGGLAIAGPTGGMAISGPTGSGGGGAGPGGFDPKATNTGAPPPPGDDETRGKSYTIYVIGLGLAAAVVGTFVVVAIGIALVLSQQGKEEEGEADDKPTIEKKDDEPKDTGEKRELKEAKAKSKPKPKPVEKAVEAAPAAPPKKAKDNLVIKNASGEPWNSAAVTCESGASGKAPFVDGKAVVKDIPTSETCKFSLRGGAPGGGKGRGGQTVTCDVSGGQVTCK